MITNVVMIVAITIATNVTEHWPQHTVPDPVHSNANGSYNAVYLCHFENEPNPTSKMVKTEAKEVTRFTFRWNEEWQNFTTEKVVASQTQYFILNSGWAPTTNSIDNSQYSGMPFGRRWSP